ncbi:glycosyltransferase [Virgisporangium aurantiacum]|uniref:glycosyltransferase n=1 Tax=Virgisporangium aurantiacum TaxID=175570 RepID=UPI001951C650|nr:glycosyltransferase [Virgisporangium aurantiacum]
MIVLARDEERCIARCLDSVCGRGFDDILVVDTGSTDATPGIVDGYRTRGVRMLRHPWSNSFAAARNAAVDCVATGWIVFLDADEWLTGGSVPARLAELSRFDDVSRLVFAPRIADRNGYSGDVGRIFRADSAIRYKGAVHEYPVIAGEPDEPVGIVGVDIRFDHDGYERSVVVGKDKRRRNLDLLDIARARDPDNPRWWYFTIRDGLPVLGHAQLVRSCTVLKRLADTPVATGDGRSGREYYRLALGQACQAFAAFGDWTSVHRYRADLPDADAHYFGAIAALARDVVTPHDLVGAIELRGRDELVADSVLDPAGRHLDALIVALLDRVRGEADAERYRDMCDPWTDTFFDGSRLRRRQPL